jgi:hypothetical protein
MDLRIDADDATSIRAVLHHGDVVLDAAGPFQTRTLALIETAIEVGFDVVDLSDSLGYATRVQTLRDRIRAAGIRVLTSCSAVSAVSAALIRSSGILQPVRASVFLGPAAKDTAHQATAIALLGSVGQAVGVRRAGRLATSRGWSESRRFHWPSPVARVRGYLTESADCLLLSELWPTLMDVDFWVDTGIPWLNGVLFVSGGTPGFSPLARRLLPVGLILAKRFGSAAGSFGVRVEDGRGWAVHCLLSGPQRSYLIAVAPAMLAVRALTAGRLSSSGLIPVDRQIDALDLLDYLGRRGITFVRSS